MDSRIAAELLYESEATLRMVDTAIDELQIADLEPRFTGPRLKAVYFNRDSEPAELDVPPEFCVRAYWQIHELLDCLRQCREAVQALSRSDDTAATEAPFPGAPAGVDHALSLVDRLDSLEEESSAERQAIHGDLRRELIGVIHHTDQINLSSEHLSTATILLAETEARLTKLGHLFDRGGAGA